MTKYLQYSTISPYGGYLNIPYFKFMNEKKIIILIAVVSILILFGGVYIISATSQVAPQISASSNATAFTTTPTSTDFGTVKYSAKSVVRTFVIENTGSDTLKLFNIKTSCHCTKAHATIDGLDGPDFGMSGISSWIGEVKPGKDAKIVVSFDPTYHGLAGVGPVSRFISVETNDKANSKITFTLTGTVTK